MENGRGAAPEISCLDRVALTGIEPACCKPELNAHPQTLSVEKKKQNNPPPAGVVHAKSRLTLLAAKRRRSCPGRGCSCAGTRKRTSKATYQPSLPNIPTFIPTSHVRNLLILKIYPNHPNHPNVFLYIAIYAPPSTRPLYSLYNF